MVSQAGTGKSSKGISRIDLDIFGFCTLQTVRRSSKGGTETGEERWTYTFYSSEADVSSELKCMSLTKPGGRLAVVSNWASSVRRRRF